MPLLLIPWKGSKALTVHSGHTPDDLIFYSEKLILTVTMKTRTVWVSAQSQPGSGRARQNDAKLPSCKVVRNKTW